MATTATRFDAAGDRATYSGAGGAPPTPSAGWAASWWVYISVDQNTFATMLRLWAGGTVLNLAMGSSGTAPGAYTGGGTVEVGTQCAVDTWYYLGYSVSGTTVTIYVFDAAGALFATASGTIGGGSPTGLTVGGRDASNPDEWFNGRISRMRIWSTTRTQAEFAAEQFAADPVATGNLWAHYPLAGAGDLADTAGGHNLAAGSTATTTEDGPPLSEGVTGTALVALGALSLAANGQRTVVGQVDITLGALAVTATGIRTVLGAVTVTLTGPTVNATGVRMVSGIASVVLGALATVVAGRRRVTGTATMSFGAPSVTAAGRRTVFGTVTVALAGLIVTVVVADDHNAIVVAQLAPQGRVAARLGTRRATATLGVQR
jgi:hypothetical protein